MLKGGLLIVSDGTTLTDVELVVETDSGMPYIYYGKSTAETMDSPSKVVDTSCEEYGNV